MKQLGRLKLTQVNSKKLQKKDLGSLKGGPGWRWRCAVAPHYPAP